MFQQELAKLQSHQEPGPQKEEQVSKEVSQKEIVPTPSTQTNIITEPKPTPIQQNIPIASYQGESKG